jgi:hypothetical protein
MYDERQDLLTALGAGPPVLRTLMTVIKDGAAAGGGEDGWSAVEIICHMRDAEQIAFERDQRISAEERPVLEAYDQDELARRREYVRQDLDAAIAGFEDVRNRHVDFLKGLPPAGWARVGVHQEMGELTIQQHVAHMAAHDPLHFAQLARLSAMRARP